MISVYSITKAHISSLVVNIKSLIEGVQIDINYSEAGDCCVKKKQITYMI